MTSHSVDLGDPYRRLRPRGPTPPDELCGCAKRPQVKLMRALGDSPLHCMGCHGAVTSEALPLPVDLPDPVPYVGGRVSQVVCETCSLVAAADSTPGDA